MKKILISLVTMTMILGCRQDVGFSPAPVVDNGGLTNQPSDPQPVQPDPNPVQPPIVRVLQPPADQIEGQNNQLVYEIIAGDNPVEDVECYLDNVSIDCSSDTGVITIVTPGKGPHEVTIVATDSEGLEGEGGSEWTVHDRFLRKNENIAVSSEETQSDILFVVDNSASMVQEQRGLAEKITNFIEKLDGLSWRIGIVTTDPSGGLSYDDGRLLKFPNGNYYLSNELSVAEAKNQFGQTIQRPESGSGDERGIHAVYRAIERSQNPSESVDFKHADFFRPRAALSVVLISDETETLISIYDGSVLPDQHKSNGNSLINYVKSVWGQDKLFQFNSIITRPGDDLCLETAGKGGTGLAYGVAYDDLSRKTGGVVADICSADYSSSLKLIGQEVAGLKTVYEMSCVPQDIDRDGIIDLEVTAKGGKEVPGYTIDGNKVKFDKPLKIGDYGFHYFCLNSI